jgi:hypothetical protein
MSPQILPLPLAYTKIGHEHTGDIISCRSMHNCSIHSIDPVFSPFWGRGRCGRVLDFLDIFWFSWSSQLVRQYVPNSISLLSYVACPTVVILDPIPIAGPILKLIFLFLERVFVYWGVSTFRIFFLGAMGKLKRLGAKLKT